MESETGTLNLATGTGAKGWGQGNDTAQSNIALSPKAQCCSLSLLLPILIFLSLLSLPPPSSLLSSSSVLLLSLVPSFPLFYFLPLLLPSLPFFLLSCFPLCSFSPSFFLTSTSFPILLAYLIMHACSAPEPWPVPSTVSPHKPRISHRGASNAF